MILVRQKPRETYFFAVRVNHIKYFLYRDLFRNKINRVYYGNNDIDSLTTKKNFRLRRSVK